MPLSDRLRRLRHDRFAGRTAELACFDAALAPGDLPFAVLYVYGPGGIGKSTLLEEYAFRAEAAGVPACLLDAQALPPTPRGLLRALAAYTGPLGLDPAALDALGETPHGPVPPAGAPLAVPDRAPGRRVLLIDTYEAVADLDAWLRGTLLPGLPDDVLVVIAGREPPSTPWRTDSGWKSLARLLPLGNLSPAEGEALLRALGVPEERHADAFALTHGHPLALALVAEAEHAPPPESGSGLGPDVVGTLLRRFVSDVHDPLLRRALEACALVRVTTEPLLAALVTGAESSGAASSGAASSGAAPSGAAPSGAAPSGAAPSGAAPSGTRGAGSPDAEASEQRAREAFAWLRSRTFVRESPEGLLPHALVRDVLVADLRWRDPDRYETLHARARRYYVTRLQRASSPETQQGVLADYAFLYRDHPVAGPLIAQLRQHWSRRPVRDGGPLREGEAETLCAIVERHEGPEAAQWAAHWLAAQPGGVEVFRDAEGRPAGFLLTLALEQIPREARAADPAVRGAFATLRTAALREGERAALFRFWMDGERYQSVSPVQGLVFAHTVWYYLTTPGLAFSFLPCADPEAWAQIFAFAGLRRLPEADFATDGRTFAVFGHDWRAVPPETWLARLAGREPGLPVEPETADAPTPLVVLDEQAFAEAVRDALKAYARPRRLLGNPLLQARLVRACCGPDADEAERAEALRALIAGTVEALAETPRDEPFARALRLTYLRPAPSQTIAAERIGVPFSTFRRHLARGIEHVVETLWAREVEG
ncbi:MAG: ATP-binding protein [Rubricoccaceae bacterium]